jgi:starch-binding outer membrane protein, SusD/RagB family
VGTNRSDQDYIDFRYAEILLNYAEAAVELGHISDAHWALNEIRERAGIALLDESDMTLDRVRQERQIELAFENHRYWDIRRWRIGEEIMSETQFTALYPYYVVEEDAWIFETTGVGYPKNYEPRFNYQPISQAEINRNPRLVQNPGH